MTLLLASFSVAHAQATQREYAYRLTGTLPFPEYDSVEQFCSLGSCYIGVATQKMVFSDRESACNFVLKARDSNGHSYYGNYSGFNDASPNDFFLLSVGAPYTEENGNTYDENQCILRSIKWPSYLDFTTSSRGIFGTIFFPNIRAIPVARCVGHATVSNYWFPREYIDKICPNNAPQLTLTPLPQTPPDPRPKGTEGKDGKSTLVLKATVTENGSPKKDVVVTFKVDVKAGSGEHGVTGGAVHDHRGRVEKHSGTVTPISEKTNANGEVQIKFQAPILAGTHTITATCDTCSNKTATKDVKVLVPDLVTLPADTRIPKNYILIGGDTPLGKNHPDNHYFTEAARETLKDVTKFMFDFGWGVVGVNDGSLHDGGLFDIKGLWIPSHFEHRTGTEVDLSFINPKKIGGKEFERVYGELCKKENAAFDIQTLWHKADGIEPHFHMYLDGTGLSGASGGRCCAKVFGPPKIVNGKPVLDKKGNPVLSKVCE